MTEPLIEIKNLKTAGRDESLRFEATLYLQGKKAAIVSDTGTGGCHRYHFFAADLKAEFNQLVTDIKTKPLDPTNRLHGDVQAWITSMQSSIPDYSQSNVDDDVVIDCLIEQFEENKKLRRLCKTKTVFRLPDDTHGEYRILNMAYSSGVKSWVFENHPTVKGEDIDFINDSLRK